MIYLEITYLAYLFACIAYGSWYSYRHMNTYRWSAVVTFFVLSGLLGLVIAIFGAHLTSFVIMSVHLAHSLYKVFRT